MLASYFVADGVDAVLKPEVHAARFRKLAGVLERTGLPPVLASDAAMLARVSGGVSALAGVMLALGRRPRVAAAALAVLNIPITLSNNPVWDEDEGVEKKEQWRGLFRGLGLGGGLILAAADRGGKPSIGWRIGNAREHRSDLKDQRAALIARYSDN